MDVDVIIPVYKPGKELFTLVERLEGQTVPIRNILLMNTEEKYFTQLVYGTRFLEQHREVKVYHLSKKEFNHGRTRREAVKRSTAPVFVMMTQDAMPADEYLLERLAGYLQGNVAVAYARQLPAPGCGAAESYMRQFNYPEQSRIKTLEDLPELGIKTYFCSNVCAAYRRDVYEESEGFVKHTIFNEDMLYAAAVMRAGYSVAYAAEACVVHSHNYTNGQQFRRNFDLGVSQADHPEVFGGLSSEGEGKKMVLQTVKYLKKQGMRRKIPHLYLQTACKYAGYLLGKHYQKLPRSWILKCTDNREYWDQNQ